MPRGRPEIHEPPRLDRRARTEFLRRSMARAMTPRARKRAAGLLEMERLLARRVAGFSIGLEGHMLASIARAFPVSYRAIELELRGRGPQDLVQLAERIELGFWTRPDWDKGVA